MRSRRKFFLTLLFDGACPICEREIKFLKSRDKENKIQFVDIDQVDYSPSQNHVISYR